MKGCLNLYESYPKLKTSHPVRHGEEEGFFIIEIRLKNENVLGFWGDLVGYRVGF